MAMSVPGWLRSVTPALVSLCLGAATFGLAWQVGAPLWLGVALGVLVMSISAWLIPRPAPSPDERPFVNPRVSKNKVGVEIEFVGVEVELVTQCVADEFGGEIERRHDYEWFVNSDLGKFRIELDSRPMKDIAERAEESPDEYAKLRHEILREPAATLVPCEIVTPPLPEDALPRLDRVIARLGEMGGHGTHDGLLYAFGVHFNPAIDPVEAPVVLKTLRAFSLLADWLRRHYDVDVSRDLSPYVKPYPHGYRCRILHDDYPKEPSFEVLIDDYLKHNPTRNRALDMLPLFAHVDEARVREVVGADEKVNTRPTYHYRLPNAEVGREGWTVSSEWESWVLVRQLAGDDERLERYRQRWWELVGEVELDKAGWDEFLDGELL